jgi:hypothetical protein
MPYKLTRVILVATILCGAAAQADKADGDASMFSFGGFGTLSVVHSNDNQADFSNNAYQPTGPGFSRRWSATESKLGGQVAANFNDKLSAVVQFVSQYQHDGTYTPYLEWGNVKYQFTPNFSIRAGRIALPTFMVSDSLNVGYTLPTVRVPVEVYSQLPITHSDGIDASYRFQIGAVTNTTQAFAGSYDSKDPGNVTYSIRKLRGITDTVEYGAATLHLSYQQLRFNYGSFIINDTQAIFSVGVNYDPGKWFVSGEWIRAPDDQEGLYYGWYVIGGYRIAKFTPYLGYARTYMTTVGSLDLPPIINQNTASAGIRWDFAKNFDLKLQFDRIERNGGLNIYFINQQADFNPVGTTTLSSLAVDFVF